MIDPFILTTTNNKTLSKTKVKKKKRSMRKKLLGTMTKKYLFLLHAGEFIMVSIDANEDRMGQIICRANWKNISMVSDIFGLVTINNTIYAAVSCFDIVVVPLNFLI